MDEGLLTGGLYVLLGALCGGSFGLPSKFAQDFPWECLWGPFFLLVTLVVPLVFAPMFASDLDATWRAAWSGDDILVKVEVAVDAEANTETAEDAQPETKIQPRPAIGHNAIILPILFGFLWGWGSMTYGMSFAMIGLALAYAINSGVQTGFGSLMPLLLQHRDVLVTTKGFVLLAGIATCVVGVVFCGYSGILKARSIQGDETADEVANPATKQSRMTKGICVALLSGFLCACFAVAVGYGKDVQDISIHNYGNSPSASTMPVLVLVLGGGFFSACLYCGFLLWKNATWKDFAKPGVVRVLSLALLMSLLHNGAIFFYVRGATALGDLGVSVGWAAFMSCTLLVGNAHGFLTGEWKGADRKSVKWMLTGIAVMVAAMCILGMGNSMATVSAGK
ncbi:MAG: hypothetical protein HQ581_19970 [Planctomycetes bacterium]|nr:hypothetical protein [Planctomycetota bacterium]